MISIRALQPFTAVLLEGPRDRLIDVRVFQYGDLFGVLSYSIILTDGVILFRETEIDESVITGESIPSPKFLGSQIVAGSVNRSGPFVARLTKLPAENTISKVADMVDEAKVSKPKVQGNADRGASIFVPYSIALDFLVFLVWVV